MKRVAVLGSTGSIGRQALDIGRAHPNDVEIVALAAGSNVGLLAEQLAAFTAARFAVADRAAGETLLQAHPEWETRCVGFGPEAVCAIASGPADVVLNGLLGYAGLRPSLAALTAGTDLALANKESMVVAGALMREAAMAHGARIIPVDSEHSAIYQCLRAGEQREVRRLILTASGGPFRTHTREQLCDVTVADALRHPTWNMGAKITIDSSTLMNKGLEILEAHWLFGMDFDAIDVLVHPQSIVHSMVEFVDGSVLAQMGTTDMRVPIWVALHDPARRPADFGRLDLARAGTLTFESLDAERFPCVRLAVEAGQRGGVEPAVLNAANEVAVEAFLAGRIRYVEIPQLIAAVLADCRGTGAMTQQLEAIAAADRRAREVAAAWIGARHAPAPRA
jgi:1-deoxy-D-xylulose-5-phosphate reductoisomerase